MSSATAPLAKSEDDFHGRRQPHPLTVSCQMLNFPSVLKLDLLLVLKPDFPSVLKLDLLLVFPS